MNTLPQSSRVWPFLLALLVPGVASAGTVSFAANPTGARGGGEGFLNIALPFEVEVDVAERLSLLASVDLAPFDVPFASRLGAGLAYRVPIDNSNAYYAALRVAAPIGLFEKSSSLTPSLAVGVRAAALGTPLFGGVEAGVALPFTATGPKLGLTFRGRFGVLF